MKKPQIQYIINLLLLIMIVSCSKTENFDSSVNNINVVSGLNIESSYLINQPINLEVYDIDDVNITTEAVFFIDNIEIPGNIVSFSELSSHEVYAQYFYGNEVFNTELKSFSIVEPPTKVLIEDFTGTWCGYCPPVAKSIELATESLGNNNIAIVSIHQNDEYTIDQEEDLSSALGVGGLPEARINRNNEWLPPYEISEIESLLQIENDLGISINSIIEDSNLDVNIRLVSKDLLVNNKIVVYLVEDGLLSNQANYLNSDQSSYFFNMGNPIEDYEHNHVLRHSFTYVTGNDLTEISPLTDYYFNYNYEINPDFNIENLAIVAIVVDSNNNAINSQFGEVNSFQDFN